MIDPRVRYSSTNVCLNWDSQAGLKYRVEGATSGVSRVVYDNTVSSSSVRSFFPGNGIEFGDDVTLAGTERLLTDFRFDYFLSPNANANEKAELFFRLNDGPDDTPGTMVFRSGEFTLDTSPSGYVIVDATELGVPVPNALTWSLVITGVDPGEEAGLLLNGPPTAGASIVSFWQRSPEGVWTRNLIDEGAVQGSFAASVKAAPNAASSWIPLSWVTASSSTSSYCLDLPNPHRLFRIVPEAGGPGPSPAPRLQVPVILADGRVQFSWNAEAGKKYELQWSPNVGDPPRVNWTTLTNVTASGALVTVTEPAHPTSSPRFYRLRVPEPQRQAWRPNMRGRHGPGPPACKVSETQGRPDARGFASFPDRIPFPRRSI